MEKPVKRQQTILNRILAAEGYVTSEELAILTGVSSKTVRSDIRAIAERQQYNCAYKIESSPGLGYRARFEEPSTAGQLRLWVACGGEDSSHSLRRHYIIQRLLAAKDGVKITDFSKELFLVPTAVSAELHQVRKFLQENYDFTLEQRAGSGLRLTGPNQHLRALMVNEYSRYERMRGGIYECSQFGSLFFQKEPLVSFISKIVESYLTTLPHHFASYKSLGRIYQAIMLIINTTDGQVELSYSNSEIYELKITRSYVSSGNILRDITGFSGIAFGEEDRLFLTSIILGSRNFLSFEEVTIKQNYYRAIDQATQIIAELAEDTGIREYGYDRVLRERLALHLLSL